MKHLILFLFAASLWGQTSGITTSGNLRSGTGSPEGSVTAPVGTVYQRADGSTGTTLYVKETGTGNTGWAAVAAGGASSGTFQALITDLKATRSTHTNPNDLLTIAAGNCMGTNKAAATLRITAGSGDGSYVAYCTDSQTIVVEHSTSAGLTVTASGLTPLQLTTPAIPEGMVPIATGTITDGAWDAPTEARSWHLGGLRISSGAGDASALSDGVLTLASDPAQVQFLANNYTPLAQFDASAATMFRGRTGTSLPGTCSVGEEFFDTDATAGSNKYGCTSSNTWTLLGGGSSYDPMDRTKIQLVDEFASGSAGTDKSGALGWWNGNQAGSGSVTAQSPSGDRFGIMRITTGTSTNDETQMQLGTLQGRWDNIANWEMQFIFRIASSAASVRTVLGLLENNSGGATANRISIRYDAASDTVFKFETCASSTCTTNSSTVTVVADTWYRGRIRSTSAGTILFSVDGESEVSHSTNVTSSTGLLPVIAVRTSTTAAKITDIDWWAFQRTGLSR